MVEFTSFQMWILIIFPVLLEVRENRDQRVMQLTR